MTQPFIVQCEGKVASLPILQKYYSKEGKPLLSLMPDRNWSLVMIGDDKAKLVYKNGDEYNIRGVLVNRALSESSSETENE